jgi:hypothetical protein
MSRMVSRVGIDHGKARPEAEAVWLIPPGETRRDECRGVVSRVGIEPTTT